MVLVLLVGLVGVTLAWLTDKTDSVVNTFTSGDINIDLKETKEDFKMVPGHTIEKDPVVTVADDSEDAWLFVKIEKSGNFDDFLTYEMADGWTQLTGETGVFYRTVLATDSTKSFSVLLDNEVKVIDTVTKADLGALTEATYPKLTFTAYAHQYNKDATSTFTAEQAWASLNPMTP